MKRAWLVALVVVAGCDGIEHPTQPGAQPAAPAVATQLALTANPPALPDGGGTVSIDIAATAGGAIGVRDARVTITASAGTLSATSVATDSTGHARIEWVTDRTGKVTASVGDVQASTNVTVPAPPAAPTPTPVPNP